MKPEAGQTMEQENGCCSQTPAGTHDAGMKLAAVF